MKRKEARLNDIKAIFDELIQTIDNLDEFNQDKIKELIEKF